MRAARARSQAPVTGFSLVELAIVLFIVGLLMLSLMYTLSAQVDQRNFEETRRRLEQARELVLAFAIVNGRLPCPARANSAGIEVRISETDPDVPNRGKCRDALGVEDYYGGTPGGVVGGLLPAVTIAFQPTDPQGFAVDAWGNRIRYAVANTITGCAGTVPHFVHAANLKANGITCQPSDLIVCNVNQVIAPGNACAVNTAVTNKEIVAAIVISTGKNGATSGGVGADEAANLNGDRVFVFHTPTPSAAANGEFDDQFTWITVGELYGKMIAAGQLP